MTDIGPGIAANRRRLADRYVIGSGIEIGALDAPFPVDTRAARVRYVDRLPKSELLQQYPELTERAGFIRDPDIIDDGEALLSLTDDSQDFIIASHFLEHCENPLATLASHCRVLKPGGYLILAVPNTANPASSDHKRVRTSFEHVVKDDVEGPQISREDHYHEWVTFAGNMTGDVARAEKEKLMSMSYSIHFHCWEEQSFHEFLNRAISYKNLPVKIVHRYVNPYEIAVVLKKTTSHSWVNQPRSLGRLFNRAVKQLGVAVHR